MQGASCILSICPELLPLGLQRFCQCFCSLRSFHVGLHITTPHVQPCQPCPRCQDNKAADSRGHAAQLILTVRDPTCRLS